MKERSSFDPVGSLLRFCTTIFIGAILVTIAVHLIAAIWPWLLGLLIASVVTVGAVRLYSGHRGQRW